MPKKIIIENNDDISENEQSSDSDTLTKSKPKKIIQKKEKILEPKPKKRMTESQLNNLKKGQEILQKNREKNKLNKKIEASKILLENNIDVAPKKSDTDEEKIKKKPVKKVVEESDEEDNVIILKKKKKPKTIIVEESESESESETVQPIKQKLPLKSQENKKSSIKINHPNFSNFFKQ